MEKNIDLSTRVDARTTLLDAIGDVKGASVRAQVQAGESWLGAVDSLDLLEILMAFDQRSGCVTDPQLLPDSLDSFDAVVERLSSIHATV